MGDEIPSTITTQQQRQYVKDQLASGASATALVAELSQAGYTQEQIDEAFRVVPQNQPMGQTVGADQPTITPTSTETAPAKKSTFDWHHFDATKAFVVLGSILVVAAVIIVVYSQWESVSPWTRIMFLALPMLLLFALGIFLSNKEKYQSVGQACLALAVFIFPLTVGTFLYQLKIVDQLDAYLVLVSAISGLVLSGLLEFIGKKHYLVVPSLANLFVAYAALVVYLEWRELAITWVALGLSASVLGLGFWLAYKKWDSGKIYVFVATFSSYFLLPSAVILSLLELGALTISPEVMMLVISIFGLLSLGIASLYNSLRPTLGDSVVYRPKRLIEELAPLAILFPLLGLSFGQYGTTFILLSLVVSVVMILLRTKFWIWTLAPIGIIGTVASVLWLTGNFFVESLGWPVVVFLAGFAAIGIGLLIKKLNLFRTPEASRQLLWGIGKDPSVETGGSSWGGLKIIGLLVVLLIIGSFVPMLFFGLRGGGYQEPRSDFQSDPFTTQDYSLDRAAETMIKNKARNLDTALAQYYVDNDSKYPLATTKGGVNIEELSVLLSGYLASTDSFRHQQPAKYITSADGAYFAQAWCLSSQDSQTATVGNGVYQVINNSVSSPSQIGHISQTVSGLTCSYAFVTYGPQ